MQYKIVLQPLVHFFDIIHQLTSELLSTISVSTCVGAGGMTFTLCAESLPLFPSLLCINETLTVICH